MNYDPAQPVKSARERFGLLWQDDAMIALDHDQPTHALGFIFQAEKQLEAMKEYAVFIARAQGETWQAIADAMGITRQAAQQRYGGTFAKLWPAEAQ